MEIDFKHQTNIIHMIDVDVFERNGSCVSMCFSCALFGMNAFIVDSMIGDDMSTSYKHHLFYTRIV